MDDLWKRAYSREKSLKIRKLLSGTRPVERRAGVIVVDLQEEIRHLLDLSRGALEGVLGRELGESVRLEFAEPKPAPTGSQDDTPADQTPPGTDDHDAIEQNELVRTTMELFDAEIIEIKPDSPKQRSL